MKKDRRIMFMAVTVVSFSVLVVILPLLFWIKIDFFASLIIGILFGGGLIATLALVPLLFSLDILNVSIPEDRRITPHEAYLNCLSKRMVGDEEPNGVKFNTTRYTCARVLIRNDHLSIRAGLTSSGANLVFLLMLMGFTSILATALIILSFKLARDFALKDGLVQILTEKRERFKVDPVSAKLLTLLAKSERFARHALDARKSTSIDLTLLAVSVGMIGGAWVLIHAYVDLGVGETNALLAALGYALLFALAVSIPVVLFYLSYFRPQIAELTSWIRRIRTAMGEEESGEGDFGGADSSLVLLFDISKRLPLWMKYRRTAGHLRDPGIWILMALLLSILLSMIAVGVLSEIGLILLIAIVVLYVGWRARAIKEDARELQEWNAYLDSVRSRIFEESSAT